MEELKVTFEDIKKANETIVTTDIKGKQYSEVNQRIKAFRMVYPTGTLKTEMISNENGICVFRAYVYDGEKLLSTGTAFEKENSSFINKTSYIENCETSALGRALGIAGFGIDTSVASAEEVQNAINNQNTPVESKEDQEEQLELIREFNRLAEKTGLNREALYESLGVKSNASIPLPKLKEINESMRKKVGDK